MADIALSNTVADTPVARRNVFLLTAASAFAGAIGPVGFSLGGLVGAYLLGPDKSLATLPVSAFTVGVALAAIPAAMLMRRIGRRAGFQIGAVLGAASGIATGYAILAGSFALFVIGMAACGAAGAFTQQYRFAAADTGSPGFRARAISWVMAGGIAAAVIGPQTVIWTRDLTSPIPFAGSYFAISILALVALVMVSLLGGTAVQPPARAARNGGRPLREIVRQPRFVIAVACATASYAAMSLVMTAAPLAMVGCGLGQDNAALGIQWHLIAMFAPSFITGSLIARFGKERIIAIGLVLFVGCVAVALLGIELAHFWGSLVLLGIGWNFAFVGGTAMLTEAYRPEEQGKVQGLNDFIVFGAVAIASLSSGQLLTAAGWQWVNLASLPVIALAASALLLGFVRARARPT